MGGQAGLVLELLQGLLQRGFNVHGVGAGAEMQQETQDKFGRVPQGFNGMAAELQTSYEISAFAAAATMRTRWAKPRDTSSMLVMKLAPSAP
jgi:hypothetical protein